MIQLALLVHPGILPLPRSDLPRPRNIEPHQLQPELLVEPLLVRAHYNQLRGLYTSIDLRLCSFDCLPPHLGCKQLLGHSSVISSCSSLLPLPLRDSTPLQDRRASIENKDRLDSVKQQLVDSAEET